MIKKAEILAVVFVILNLCAVNLRADIVPLAPNSNSIIQDGIEYYTQTDKAVYDLGEYVEILHRVTNLRDEPLTFTFGNQQQCSFEVWGGESRIWWWPKHIEPAGSGFTLQPGEFKEFLKDWDMMNDNDTITPIDDFLVSPGIYEVSGQLLCTTPEGKIPESVGVPIQIIPEPATIFLLALGSLFLTNHCRYRRIKYD